MSDTETKTRVHIEGTISQVKQMSIVAQRQSTGWYLVVRVRVSPIDLCMEDGRKRGAAIVP